MLDALHYLTGTDPQRLRVEGNGLEARRQQGPIRKYFKGLRVILTHQSHGGNPVKKKISDIVFTSAEKYVFECQGEEMTVEVFTSLFLATILVTYVSQGILPTEEYPFEVS